MDKKIYGIFVAGGSGTRMQSSTPKQFLPLCGAPILQRTIESFLQACPKIKVITVLPKTYMPHWKELCIEHNLLCPQILVAGGITRFHSVQNALKKVPDGAIVVIHDGVRPFVNGELINTLLETAAKDGAAIPVTPSVDTLKSLTLTEDGSLLDEGAPDPDRSKVWRVQTPQVFRSEDIKAAYRQGFDISFTDDGSVARKMGMKISYVQGDGNNIKITTPEDLPLAEFLYRRREE